MTQAYYLFDEVRMCLTHAVPYHQRDCGIISPRRATQQQQTPRQSDEAKSHG